MAKLTVVTVEGGIADYDPDAVFLVDFDNAEQDPTYARDMADMAAAYGVDGTLPPDVSARLVSELQSYWQ